ncbi:PRC-barrel domain-containing protein [Geosporobacter ferrireducens]|uniref:PRC-barrel domain-containing protein n=1 Tax=Geosporobacter ferrireducens TaxID=1424294 RepID=A0A1D8GD94_9FIRM|nr:PRC-barrel domain-containing protein [Geosporobacter ferrireducens]AOT68852.1 hypothetical protein Gferi_04355 [Geosporobacter ferrireducens]MTI54915.1 hypothetical protein [Geosporobacter ferrireducens]
MKSLKEIINLPIISVFEGQEVGRIKNVVVNPENGTVEYFVVDDKSMFQIKVVPMSKIMGIGDEALMIETAELLIDAQQEPKVVDLLNKNVGVVKSKVFTKKGKNLGLIREIFIDDECGKIIGCEIENDGQLKFFDSRSIITYGKEVTIVEHELQDQLKESLAALLDGGKVEIKDIVEVEVSATTEAFQKKQREYLIGREVSKTIMDGETMLAYEGEMITEELIHKMENAGKFLELTLHVK